MINRCLFIVIELSKDMNRRREFTNKKKYENLHFFIRFPRNISDKKKQTLSIRLLLFFYFRRR